MKKPQGQSLESFIEELKVFPSNTIVMMVDNQALFVTPDGKGWFHPAAYLEGNDVGINYFL